MTEYRYTDTSGTKSTCTGPSCSPVHDADGRITKVQTFVGNQHPVDLFYWRAVRLKPIPDRVVQSVKEIEAPANEGVG